MTAGAIAESEAADALAEATANAAKAADGAEPNGVPEPVVASRDAGNRRRPGAGARARGDRGHEPGRCSRGGNPHRHTQRREPRT